MDQEYEVLVVGAGPVGLTLAIDLGRRGVRVLLVEQDAGTKPYPKMDRSNARTMEIFRRLGVADDIRAQGYPDDASMDVFIVTTLAEPALVRLHYPTVAELRAASHVRNDGSMPAEPYQLVSQNRLEPVLRAHAERTIGVAVRYATQLIGFEQSKGGVTARIDSDGAERTVRCRYMVGCDGGASLVRKTLGIPLSGRGSIRSTRQIHFRSRELYQRIPVGKGRHYYFADAGAAAMVVQGDRQEFTLNAMIGADADPEAAVRERIGVDFDFELLNVRPWKLHLLLADRYRDGRVFIAGDAAHLVIPTGGLGMNTGIGDAVDLGWKLAGTIRGWGGPGLLDSYEPERRAVGMRAVEASGWAAEGMGMWRAAVGPDIRDAGPAGSAARAKVAALAERHHRRVHEMAGVELGYSYEGSPLIRGEVGGARRWDTIAYAPTARPGERLPHLWLADGRAMQDVAGQGYTLLVLGEDCEGGETTAIERAFAALAAPLTVVRCGSAALRDVYGASFLLLRPDLHIYWSGERIDDPDDMAAGATGREGRGA